MAVTKVLLVWCCAAALLAGKSKIPAVLPLLPEINCCVSAHPAVYKPTCMLTLLHAIIIHCLKFDTQQQKQVSTRTTLMARRRARCHLLCPRPSPALTHAPQSHSLLRQSPAQSPS